MADNFVSKIDGVYVGSSSEESLLAQYERVVVQSLITSFGLDFLVQDQHGGDVDTIHNVRNIGKDPNMFYKNSANAANWDNRGQYNSAEYHSGPNYTNIKHEARKQWQSTGENIKDQYTGGDVGFYGRSKAINANKKAELDHIISAKEIHEDRGRTLAQLDGKDLADSESNLAFTNKSLNASMQDKSIEEYIKEHPELDETTKRNLLEKDQAARRDYNQKVNVAYYTGSAFIKDTAWAAGKVGLAMGVRQALGLVFSEIWFAIKARMQQSWISGAGEFFNNLAVGCKEGLINAKNKFPQIWEKFIEGSFSGVLSSLTTTLCNTFLTTAKNIVKIIRNAWASLVEATKILFLNPEHLPAGERFRAAAKILATGASFVVGTMFGEMIASTGIGAIPVLGGVIETFCSVLVTGILSCSLLYLLDNNQYVKQFVNFLNMLSSVDDFIYSLEEQSRLLDEYAAKLMSIDFEQFQRETSNIINAVSVLSKVDVNDQQGLNAALQDVSQKMGVSSPYGKHKDIDSFMSDPDSVLTFS